MSPAGTDRARRQEFCRRVLESLSDILEGEAPEDFCREVDEVLGECQPYQAFRSTLEETIRLTRGLADGENAHGIDEDAFQKCVEKVRGRLESDPSS
jgi:hypothetical protein